MSEVVMESGDAESVDLFWQSNVTCKQVVFLFLLFQQCDIQTPSLKGCESAGPWKKRHSCRSNEYFNLQSGILCLSSITWVTRVPSCSISLLCQNQLIYVYVVFDVHYHFFLSPLFLCVSSITSLFSCPFLFC